MSIINLVNKEESRIKYNIIKFSDSQVLVNIDSCYSTDTVLIKSRMSWEDLQIIIATTEALRNIGVKNIKLYVPYFLGARSDRSFSKYGVRYLKQVICPIINNLNFTKVIVKDPHSSVLENVLNNIEIEDNLDLIDFALQDFDLTNVSLCFPDEGAKKRYENILKKYNLPYFNCSKKRDVSTGEIIETIIEGESSDYKNNILILDDIIDGGKTFIEIGKKLSVSNPSSELYLCVTHGILSKGLDELRKYFSKIYCTNSFSTILPFEYHNTPNVLTRQLNIF